jgi:Fe-S-cluster-containing hydrogenase component 2
MLDPDTVLGHFDDRLMGLDEKSARTEVDCCMSCGMCFECNNCVIYCPQLAVKRHSKKEYNFDHYVFADYSKCICCHICADVCPTGNIQMGLGE